MFCTQCGSKILIDAKFCTNCGHKILVHLSNDKNVQKQVEVVDSNPNGGPLLRLFSYMSTKDFKLPSVGELSRKVKRGVSSAPIITALGDAVLGASGLDDLQKKIRNDPNSPINWLFYYEAFVTYSKVKSGANVARLVFNPVGFAVSQGASMGLNVADNTYTKFDPQICLNVGLSLAYRNIKSNQFNSQDLLAVGKLLFYKAINETESNKKQDFLLQSLYYTSLAIEIEEKQEYAAEYFFYLAQTYNLLNNEEQRLRSLNISRKLGFVPSLNLLKGILIQKGIKVESSNDHLVSMIQEFKFTYDSGGKLEKAFKYTLNEQGKKITNTSELIKKILDT